MNRCLWMRYNRLPYGVSSTPGILQRTMEGLLQGTPSTGILLDNILVTGPRFEERLPTSLRVLEGLSDAGLRLKGKKCQFMKSVLDCLRALTRKGSSQLIMIKDEAFNKAPIPTNPFEFNNFLGMATSMSSLCPTYHQPWSHY